MKGWLLVLGLVVGLMLMSGPSGAEEKLGKPPQSGPSSHGQSGIAYSETLTRRLPTELLDRTRYLLGPGDVLTVAIWGAYNYVSVETISADGQIYVPTVGLLSIGGMSLVEAEALFAMAVTRYYKAVASTSGLALQSLKPDPVTCVEYERTLVRPDGLPRVLRVCTEPEGASIKGRP